MGLDLIHAVPSNSEEIEYFTLDEFKENPEYIQRHKHLFKILDDPEEGPVQVLYYTDKGYQRKQVSKQFYIDFENEKLYFDLETVKKVLKYLKPSADDTKERLKTQFTADFITNFVEGESIFFASW